MLRRLSKLSPLMLRSLFLSAAIVGAPGCLVWTGGQTTKTGVSVPEGTFAQLKPGTTPMSWVQANLGEPTSKAKDGNDEVWKYSGTEKTTSYGGILFIYGGEHDTQATTTFNVEFKDDLVINKWKN